MQPRLAGAIRVTNDIGETFRPDSPADAMRQVASIIREFSPGADLACIETSFNDIVGLFAGMYPGYRRCLTEYHDLRHTTSVTLAMVRLMHGAVSEGMTIPQPDVELGVLAALLHDTGYIQKEGDDAGTGAKYTLTHVDRGVEFAREYLTARLKKSLPDAGRCGSIIMCTQIGKPLSSIPFEDEQTALLGKMLGTADLLGQMADRMYLEKLLFLFREFTEGGIGNYENEFDLLRKTVDYLDSTRERLAGELGGISRLMRSHFRARHNVDRDLYGEAILRNRAYLENIIDMHAGHHRRRLRRGGIVERLESEGK
jgi:hypothetical protein